MESRQERAALLLIEAGAPIDDVTILCQAISFSVVVLHRMCDSGLIVNQLCDMDGRTPLHFAVECELPFNSVLMHELVHTHHSDMNARDMHGNSCCHTAAYIGKKEHLNWLISAGVYFEVANDDGYTPLHLSTISDNYSCALVLVAAGANVNACDSAGRTACQLAAEFGDTAGHVAMANVHLFLAAGADLDASAREQLAEWDLFVDNDEVELARRRIAKTRLDFVRGRALQICLGLQSRELDAL